MARRLRAPNRIEPRGTGPARTIASTSDLLLMATDSVGWAWSATKPYRDASCRSDRSRGAGRPTPAASPFEYRSMSDEAADDVHDRVVGLGAFHGSAGRSLRLSTDRAPGCR